MTLRTMLPVVIWLALLACAATFAQEQAEPDAVTEAEARQPAATPDADEDEDTTPAAEDQSYLDIEEDDFRPSEEIPTDQSITFPTDI